MVTVTRPVTRPPPGKVGRNELPFSEKSHAPCASAPLILQSNSLGAQIPDLGAYACPDPGINDVRAGSR
jgi:hypothetical protein